MAGGSANGAKAHVACWPEVRSAALQNYVLPAGLSVNGANLINDAFQIFGQQQSKVKARNSQLLTG